MPESALRFATGVTHSMPDLLDDNLFRAARALVPIAPWGVRRHERVLSYLMFHREELTVMRSLDECRAILATTVKPWVEFQVSGDGGWRGTFDRDAFDLERFGLSGYMVVEGRIVPTGDRCTVEMTIRWPPYLMITGVLVMLFAALVAAMGLQAGDPKGLLAFLFPTVWASVYGLRFRCERNAALGAIARLLCGETPQAR